MERTGFTPPGAVVAQDLAEVVQAPGPFYTVYLTTVADTENAAYRSEQHWKSVRRDLGLAGASDELLAHIDGLVPEAHLWGQALAVVANASGVLHVEHGPDPPAQDRWTVGPLPRLLPVLVWRQWLLPHVTVLADRAGADIAVHCHQPADRRHQADLQRQAGGTDDPLARSSPGGWSQRRYQQRAENTWEQNAEEVAASVADLVDRYDARLVIAAGDVRAIELLRKSLPELVLERFEVVDGGRSADGSDEAFGLRVREQVRAAADAETEALLEKYREELGQADRAADGPDDALAALSRAQVEVLLVGEGAEDQRVGYVGPEPTQVGRTAETLVAMGVDDPREAPLVDVAISAALASGAGVRVVPEGDVPTGRIGAILRWS